MIKTIIFWTLITICLVSMVAIKIRERKNFTVIDAKTNRDIAEINKPVEKMPWQFRYLLKKINKAAKKGKTYIRPKWHINIFIMYSFSKKDIREFFEPLGYKVKLVYDYTDDQSIEEISW